MALRHRRAWSSSPASSAPRTTTTGSACPRTGCRSAGFFSALEPLALLGMAMYAYSAMRRSGLAHPNTLALHWTIGSAVFTLFGAGLLGLAHTWPAVNKWTHGTLITAMHGHTAFYGAYAMIVLAMITYALPSMAPRPFGARQQHRLLVVLAAARRHVRHDPVVRDRRHRAGLPRAHPRHRLPGDAAEDPGPLPDAARHRRRCSRSGWRCSSSTSSAMRRASRSRTDAPAAGAAGSSWPRACRAVRPAATGAGPRSRSTSPSGDEVALFEQCHARRLAVMLKGPTGCGKTRFVEHMAWRLGRRWSRSRATTT